MEELVLKSTIKVAQMTELSPSEQALINSAIEATNRSYAVYSNFHVGAAVLLKNGKTELAFVPNAVPSLLLGRNILTNLLK